MPIVYQDRIYRHRLRANPEHRFVFGDNRARQGYGGQAKEMRGEPNAIGVATKRYPTMAEEAFFRDGSITDIQTVIADLEKVTDALCEDRFVIVPTDGLGTGLSQLPQRAPRLYRAICLFFQRHSGPDFPWRF